MGETFEYLEVWNLLTHHAKWERVLRPLRKVGTYRSGCPVQRWSPMQRVVVIWRRRKETSQHFIDDPAYEFATKGYRCQAAQENAHESGTAG
ncbi:hypothetical protein GQ600_24797 [Phytophthora cactorum]|nr:hypothetical protein GQ600_24797 [Phytophthora cactorum]